MGWNVNILDMEGKAPSEEWMRKKLERIESEMQRFADKPMETRLLHAKMLFEPILEIGWTQGYHDACVDPDPPTLRPMGVPDGKLAEAVDVETEGRMNDLQDEVRRFFPDDKE